MNILVTGVAGFAGVHIAHELKRKGATVIGLDKLTYATDLERALDKNIRFVCHDLAAPISRDLFEEIGPVDAVVHNAAESHVNRSFVDPGLFVRSNTLGTLNLLERTRHGWVDARFIYVSTDEVFGGSGGKVGDKLSPTNPYAATKAGGEYVVNSYRRSFGLNTMITRTCNMFGPGQHAEKFIPTVVRKLLNDEVVQIHTDQAGNIGRRRWCHVSEQAAAISWLLQFGTVGSTYHVSAGTELSNLDVTEIIAKILNRPLRTELVVSDRPVYDTSYRLQPSSVSNTWRRRENFVELLRDTVLCA